MTKFDTTAEGILNLLSQGEGQSIEFKRRLSSDVDVARNLGAFANADGGILLVGVEEDGTPIGLSVNEAGEAMARMVKIASSLLDVPSEIGSVDWSGRQIVYATIEKVPAHLGPILTSRGEVYTRQGARNTIEKPSGAKPEKGSDEGLTGAMYEEGEGPTAFVAISFRDEEEPALVDYYDAIERALKRSRLSLRLKRIDLEEGDYEISQKVMDQIDRSVLLIADFTLSPANVYFELGYARGRGIRVIQTARKDTVLEFDIRNWRTIFYRNAHEFEEKLVPAFNQVSEDNVVQG